MHKPTISNDAAVTQAGVTIKQYLHQAVEHIDEIFGEGYAKKNPALLAACVQAQAADFNSALVAAGLWEVKDAVDEISNTMDRNS